MDGTTTSITITNVLDAMTTVLEVIMGMFGNVIDTVTGNPIIFVPVLFAILGGIILFAIGLIRKFGVRGISSTGRRRRRAR